MAIAYRASAQVFGTTTSTNITIPAGVQIGDMLVMHAVGGWAPSVPAGWTQDYLNSTSGNIRACVAYRVAQAGDAGSTLTVTWAGGYNHVINIIAVSGSTTFRTPTQHYHSSTGGTAVIGPDGAANGDFVIYLGGNRQDGGPPTLSRGTTAISAADGSTIAGGFVAYELMGADAVITNTLTTSIQGSGYLYSLMVLSDGNPVVNPAVTSSNYVEALTVSQSNAQVESNYVEALTVSQSNAQVESNYVEVLHSTAAAEVDAVYAEALVNGTPYAEIESVYAEALVNGTPYAEIESVYAEALISAPRLQAETVYAEILDSGTPNVRGESVYAEVLDSGTPNVQSELVYAEVLVSLVNFPARRGWGITSI